MNNSFPKMLVTSKFNTKKSQFEFILRVFWLLKPYNIKNIQLHSIRVSIEEEQYRKLVITAEDYSTEIMLTGKPFHTDMMSEARKAPSLSPWPP